MHLQNNDEDNEKYKRNFKIYFGDVLFFISISLGLL